jgi:hypothetical protein
MWLKVVDVACWAAALLLILHWFPWGKIFGGAMPRLAAYGVGALVLVGVPSVAVWGSGISSNDAVLLYLAALLAGGAAVAGAWAVDFGLESWHTRRDKESVYGSEN